MTTAALLLAAGGGSRFAGPTHKLLAPLRGRPVFAWALEAVLAAGFDEVVVVTGAADLRDLLPPVVTVVANPRWAEGQATSLWAGLGVAGRAGHDAVVVGLGDQPFIGAGCWRAVAMTGAVTGATPIAVATYGGKRRNPVRLHRDVWPLVPTDGDEGARSVMRLRPELVTEVACQGDPGDIDTAADLAELTHHQPQQGA